ncbi:hypothetical protein LDENG_00207260 [Lucifuga dentata]|nr:hypothetical protein LDENG_00207260 [Lucifuga dentata]
MYFLRQLQKFRLSQTVLLRFYTAIIESVIIVHLCLVRLCNITIQAQTSMDCAVCRADHWLSTPLHNQPAVCQVRKESKIMRKSWPTPHTLDTHSFSISPL